MANDQEKILVFGVSELETPSGEVRRGLSDLIKGAASKASEVAVSTLQENMQRFLSQVDAILTTSPKEIGGLALDEVEIHAQIDSNGNIGITSALSAEIALQGGIKFVLRKKP